MSLSDILVILALVFLGLHLLFDLKALRQAVAHRKDVWWTATTSGLNIWPIQWSRALSAVQNNDFLGARRTHSLIKRWGAHWSEERRKKEQGVRN